MYSYFDEDILKKNLVKLRKDNGLTQKQVEAKLKLRSLTMHDYESGRLNLPLSQAIKLAGLYNCRLENLLGIELEKDLKKKQEEGINNKKIAPLIELGVVANKNFNLSQKILNDPIIIAESNKINLKPQESIFNLVTSGLSSKQKRAYIIQLLRYVNSIIGSDRKVTTDKIFIRDTLIANASIDLTEQELSSIKRSLTKQYFGGSVDKVFSKKSLKHFLIWCLYMVVFADGKINYKEEEYINLVANHISLPLENLGFIREQITLGVDEIF